MGNEINPETLSTPYVYQLSVKNTHKTDKKDRSPRKISTTSIQVYKEGCKGDYNDYRTKHKQSTNDRALSLITTEILEQLNTEGWPIKPGDLGENITIAGDLSLELGQKYSIGTVTLEITEEIVPCNKLSFLPYVGKPNKSEFLETLKGRRGWYARVLTEGTITVRDKVNPLI